MPSALAAAPQKPATVTLSVMSEVPAQAADAITKAMPGDAQILRADKDHTRKWQGTPSDTSYSNQWALQRVLQEAIDYAWSKNVVLAAAAGNEGKHGDLRQERVIA